VIIACFIVLAAMAFWGPYLVNGSDARRHRLYVALTIAFLAWLLPLMAALR
jgi:hypothetical protein